MNLKLTLRERGAVGAIYTIVTVVTVAALAMAFDHARHWSDRHAVGGGGWEGWAFAIMIELPAVMGLLLLQVWDKLAAGRKRTVPRALLAVSYSVSAIIQQAYAGPHASPSTRIVAGLPTVVAGVFVEIMFMLMGMFDGVKADMAAEQRGREEAARQRVGLGDMPAPPTLTSPDRTSRPDPTWRPDIEPDTHPDIEAPPAGHDRATSARQDPDTPQVNADEVTRHEPGQQLRRRVRPDVRPWADLPDIDPDTEAAERVVRAPDVLTADRPDADIRRPDTTGNVRSPEPDTRADTSPDTDAKRMSDPRWAEAAAMRRNGKTIKAIAEHFGVTDRTVSRWKLPEPDSTKPANGHVPDLTGANR